MQVVTNEDSSYCAVSVTVDLMNQEIRKASAAISKVRQSGHNLVQRLRELELPPEDVKHHMLDSMQELVDIAALTYDTIKWLEVKQDFLILTMTSDKKYNGYPA